VGWLPSEWVAARAGDGAEQVALLRGGPRRRHHRPVQRTRRPRQDSGVDFHLGEFIKENMVEMRKRYIFLGVNYREEEPKLKNEEILIYYATFDWMLL